VLSISALVQLFGSAGRTDRLQDADAVCSVASVVLSDKFARLTTASSKHPNFSRDPVRRAAYLTILSLCKHANPIISAKEDHFGKAIFGAVGEKSPANAEDMWNALLTFLQTCPSVWHATPNFAKFAASAAFPRLFSQIRHGFHGSALASFPTLLPLLSLIPLDVVLESSNGRCALYAGVLDNCLKYLESAESRFHNRAAITAFFECLAAFFTIFLNTEAATVWLGEHEDVADGYVNQFEKPIVGLLKLVLGSASIPDEVASFYVTELGKMQDRVHIYSAKSDVSGAIKDAFAQKLDAWIEKTVLGMVSDLSVEPHRFSTLIQNGLRKTVDGAQNTSQFWSALCKTVYHESIAQLHAFIAESSFEDGKCASLTKLLSVVKVLYSTAPSTLLVGDGSADEHFAEHFRPVICAVSSRLKIDQKALKSAMEQLLVISRSFFLAAADKKMFLLQLFKDFDVQFGDIIEATAIIQHTLQFPVTQERSKLWTACGSWQQSEAAEASTDPTLDALTAIWKGKLLDEFFMISLKGRLDDLNPGAFKGLLEACLGGATNCPLVSPDAVVIFSHFAVQNGAESPDMLVMILEQLCSMFAKLDVELPSELEAVEGQLYTQLFHLSARGSYATASNDIWSRTAKQSMQRWQKQRVDEFVSDLAAYVNGLLVANPSKTSSFNEHLFSAYAKKFLLLSFDPAFSVNAVASKLDIIHVRCEEASQSLFFNRLLGCLGSVCEDERVVAVLKEYYTELAPTSKDEAVKIVSELVDVDVSHAMTWFIFHPHESKASWGRVSSRLEILESYLTLEPLYEALRGTGIFEVALQIAAAQIKNDAKTNSHRDLVFAAKADEASIREHASILPDEHLMQSQHDDLESLVVGAICLYTSASSRASLVDQVLARGDDSTNLVEPVIVSLMKDIAQLKDSDADRDAVFKALQSFFESLSKKALDAGDHAAFLSYVGVAASCWSHVANQLNESDTFTILFPPKTIFSVLDKIQQRVSPSSTSVIEVGEWIRMLEFASALSSSSLLVVSDELRSSWEKAVRVLLTHGLSGKQELSKVSNMKIHKRSKEISEREKNREDQFVLQYPHELARARLATLKLLSALTLSQSELLHELTAFYREALLSTVLCTFAESAELSAHVVTTYVSLDSPAKSFQLIQLSMTIEASLKSTFSAVHLALTSIHDTARVRELVLECFGGVDGLASLFDASRYPMTPAQRVLLYILAAYSGALRARSLADTAIDINADDEAATEAALARALIPRALRKSLRAVFGDDKKEADTSNIRMRSRRQKPQEREDLVGRLLLWDLFLQLFPRGGPAADDEDTSSASNDSSAPGMVASALSSYAAKYKLLTNFLSFCTALLSQESAASLAKKQEQHVLDLQNLPLFKLGDLEVVSDKSSPLADLSFDKSNVFLLGTRVFFRTAVRLPAMVRTWWNDECSRSERSWAAKYFEDNISPFMLASELEVIASASEVAEAWDADEMTVKGSRVSREITTTYMKDECALEMVIRVPAAYPLRCVEVECTKRIGIAEDRWRRWVLQIIRVTSSQDGSLLDAVLLWKQNIDKEFEGVEPCPICYSILNPKTMGLPNLPCKTCANKYHNSCLYKWFNQSGKNKCPICQQPFY
jgi:hypothetical protein